MSAENPHFRYWLDGQTLVIEDLLAVAPDYAERVRTLIANGSLTIGPYYCQPDWQLTGGELLLRNLLYGRKDLDRYGRTANTGWLVDTFGHISQSPQIHRLFNIDTVYVWRGVPVLEPYFTWQAADNSQLLAVNLFGGYRNLYGLTYVPETAVQRLLAEVEKLQPFYPTADLPLFDGYDLENDPEDPLTFLSQKGVLDSGVTIQEATPATFAETIRSQGLKLPLLSGELNSGKYGATFPGTFSTRTYLKLMAGDCDHLLFRLCEPLAVLAYLKGRPYDEQQYEKWGRLLLQNAVHDCLCGVSIDQVHEKMEVHYGRVFEEAVADIQQSLAVILADFAPGTYAVSTSPFPAASRQLIGDALIHFQTEGVGIFPVGEQQQVSPAARPVSSFTWGNTHYRALVNAEGQVQIGPALLGQLVVSAEKGDTYSAEQGEVLGVIRPQTPLIVERESDDYAVIRFDGLWQSEAAHVTATVRLHFDSSPLIRWQIDLDSRGTDLVVEMVFATGRAGTVYAGMPFDIVQRPFVDSDLLPAVLPDDLSKLLLGQRELNAVTAFPFHEFVALSDGELCTAVLAKGLRAYSADEKGTIRLPLRRAVEWLTRSNLENRIGDAGPFFYVPDARCERLVGHEIAVVMGSFGPDSAELLRLNAGFQNPPLLVRKQGPGSVTSWSILQEKLPMSSLTLQNESVLARFFNPTAKTQILSATYRETEVWGREIGRKNAVPPKKIVTVKLNVARKEAGSPAAVELLNRPQWRVGPNRAKPDPAILAELDRKIAALEKELTGLQSGKANVTGRERLQWEHRLAILGREQLEFLLSRLLNERKLASYPESYLFEYDEEIAGVGAALNRMRIKRRIFDYVVQVL